MDHILLDSKSCYTCKRRRKNNPGKQNKFCEKAKFMIMHNNEKCLVNPKAFLTFWTKDLKLQLHEIDKKNSVRKILRLV